MKKIVVVLVGFLVVAAVAAPKLVGDVAQDVYRQSIDNYPWDKTQVIVEHRAYEKSWFSSAAVTAFEIELGLPNMKTVTWVTTSHVQHGPVLFTDDGVKFGYAYIETKNTFEGLPQEAQDFLDIHLGSDGIQMTSLIDFKQLSHDTFNIKSFTIAKDKVTATFGGFILAGTTPLDYSAMKGEMKFPASEIIAEKGRVYIADAAGSYNQHIYKNMMMLGDASISFPLLEATSAQGNVKLEGLSVDIYSGEKDGKLNLFESFKVKSIQAPVPLTALQYDMEIKQVSIEAIEAWTDLFAQRQGQETEALSEEQIRQLVDIILQEGLALNQLLKVDGMGGSAMVDWDVKFVGFPDGKSAFDFQDKERLLEALDMHLLIEVDEKVVNATPFSAMIAPYIQQGVVSKQGDKLVVDITLVQGITTVNGQETPRETVLQLFGMPDLANKNKP